MKFFCCIPKWKRPSENDYHVNDPTDARNIIFATRLGLTPLDIRHLLDDAWCRKHQLSVAELLGIPCEAEKLNDITERM